ncbi:hypothetical protein ACN47E_007647 [Coniothyrium glycines]
MSEPALTPEPSEPIIEELQAPPEPATVPEPGPEPAGKSEIASAPPSNPVNAPGSESTCDSPLFKEEHARGNTAPEKPALKAFAPEEPESELSKAANPPDPEISQSLHTELITDDAKHETTMHKDLVLGDTLVVEQDAEQPVNEPSAATEVVQEDLISGASAIEHRNVKEPDAVVNESEEPPSPVPALEPESEVKTDPVHADSESQAAILKDSTQEGNNAQVASVTAELVNEYLADEQAVEGLGMEETSPESTTSEKATAESSMSGEQQFGQTNFNSLLHMECILREPQLLEFFDEQTQEAILDTTFDEQPVNGIEAKSDIVPEPEIEPAVVAELISELKQPPAAEENEPDQAPPADSEPLSESATAEPNLPSEPELASVQESAEPQVPQPAGLEPEPIVEPVSEPQPTEPDSEPAAAAPEPDSVPIYTEVDPAPVAEPELTPDSAPEPEATTEVVQRAIDPEESQPGPATEPSIVETKSLATTATTARPSKMGKRGKIRAKFQALGAPVEAVPILVLLKQKKKEGGDVQTIIDTMLAAVG